jgi:RNA polymerase sigma factor (TIGR02999 family)
MGDITQWIEQARAGDRPALDNLFNAMYPELRRIAHARLARNVRDTLLDTTALVHECYLKFLNSDRLRAEDRAHFVAYSATVMRSIVVDTLRARMRDRRGGDAQHLAIDTEMESSLPAPEAEVLDVDNALRELAVQEPRLAQVVEMRYFGGMKETEIAAALGVTDRTVRRDWEKARLLLAYALRG